MGSIDGFLRYKRKDSPYLSVEKRLTNYHEFMKHPSHDEIKRECARCMDCGTPFCHALGCPVVNVIPEFNDLVYRER